MPICSVNKCTRLADGQKPLPSCCAECTINRQITLNKPRTKALQAYADFKSSTKNRNKTRVAKGKEEVEVCSQEEFLSVCFTPRTTSASLVLPRAVRGRATHVTESTRQS